MFDPQAILIAFVFFVLLTVGGGVLVVSLGLWIVEGFRWHTIPGILAGLLIFSFCVNLAYSMPGELEKEQKETEVQTVKEIHNEQAC